MKPVYLEFCGLNSFSEKAQIDFQRLLSGGVFGIFGDTGSGKSTILDSIHFALYGEIDRAPKSFNDCINHRADGAYVLFDFEITTDGARRTYRVKRERKRKSGTTKAYLYERKENGELAALAEGTREVDERLEKIIGLSFSDFKMCIALPQGDFAALVKSTSAERVKLVARLFNLEKYGERLSKAVNEKYYRAEEEVNLIKAKMSENDGGDETQITAIETSLKTERQSLERLTQTLSKAEENYRTLLTLQKEKRDYETLSAQLETLEKRLSFWQEKRSVIERIPQAKSVAEKANALQETQTKSERARQAQASAIAAHEKSLARLETHKTALEKGGYEEKILQLSLQLQKVKDSAQDRATAANIKKELDACRAAYKTLLSACVEEDFDGKRKALEEKRAALGEDATLLDYLKRHYKDVLLVDAYGDFRATLREIANAYPQTQPLVEKLLKKYTPEQVGESLDDVANLHLSFKETERKKQALQTEIDALEKRRLAYISNVQQRELIKKQGDVLRVNFELAMQKLSKIEGLASEEEYVKQIENTHARQASAQAAVEQAQADVNAYFAEIQKQAGLVTLLSATETQQRVALEQTVKESGFSHQGEALQLLASVVDERKLKADCNAYFEEYEHCRRKHASVDTRAFASFDETALTLAETNLRAMKAQQAELLQSIGSKENAYNRLLALREKYKEQQRELAEKQKRVKVCDELRLLLRSNRFLEFIASEYLQDICVSAGKTLLSLTGGRYFLQYDKEFKVGDNLDGGNLRAVKTLSGGETFLVSLSLALSLSATICMKSLRPIEFFFLDEGFGTLDEKLVDTVMDVLGKLGKSFAVGLISHVEELKRRIENKILVQGATERHGSLVKVECF